MRSLGLTMFICISAVLYGQSNWKTGLIAGISTDYSRFFSDTRSLSTPLIGIQTRYQFNKNWGLEGSMYWQHSSFRSFSPNKPITYVLKRSIDKLVMPIRLTYRLPLKHVNMNIMAGYKPNLALDGYFRFISAPYTLYNNTAEYQTDRYNLLRTQEGVTTMKRFFHQFTVGIASDIHPKLRVGINACAGTWSEFSYTRKGEQLENTFKYSNREIEMVFALAF